MKTMLYGFLLLVGLTLCFIGISSFRDKLLFIKSSEKATAVVVDIKSEEAGGEGGTIYRPYFKFKTNQNIDIEHPHNVASSPIFWSIGDEALIIYNPNNPTDASLYTYWGIFATPIILLAGSLPHILIGAGYFVVQIILYSY